MTTMCQHSGRVVASVLILFARITVLQGATLINDGSFESPTIDQAIAMGSPGQAGLWAGNVQVSGWLGTAGLNKGMVVDGNQNLYWNDPQGASLEQTLNTQVSPEIGRTYTVQYTRQINALPSIKTLEFRAELLVGGQVVDSEVYSNVSVVCNQHRLTYGTDGSRSGQPITIRFSANANKGWTQASEIQSVFIDQVQVLLQPRLAAVLTPNGLELTWGSSTGWAYSLERAARVPGTWLTVASGIAAAPPVNRFVDGSQRSSTACFYRIRVE